MKYILSKILKVALLVTVVCALQNANAQAPQKMSYQAVVRNSSNVLVTSKSVGIRISILKPTATGSAVYVETHVVTTNENGLASLEIGGGTVVTGTWAGITWSTGGPYFIRTETDPTGGINYTIAGTSQLMSVPYALFAATGNPGPIGATGPQGLPGVAGAQGAQGLQGIQGPVGATGAQGLPGAVGATGAQGPQGVPGATGAQGIQGIQGPVGATGPPGPTGWGLTGNTGTTATNFIGTADDRDIIIKRNNVSAGLLATLNTAYGVGSLNSLVTGNSNTAIGSGALGYNTTGNSNTAIGIDALRRNTTGGYNTANGRNSLFFNTTGFDNTAIGADALYSNTGSNNTANGRSSLYSNTTGSWNTAIGMWTLTSNTTGNYNSATGTAALERNTTGGYNTATGYQTLTRNTIGGFNTALGHQALANNVTGNSNTALGDRALLSVSSGSNNIGIGREANVPSATGSNQVRIGSASISYAGIQVAWTISSDRRWKTDIESSDLGLDFIKKLNPVSYTRISDEVKKTEYGFIAQEVDEILTAVGVTNSGIITKDDAGMYNLRYNDFLAPMVKAMQELAVRNTELEKYVDGQQEIIEGLKKQNELQQKINQTLIQRIEVLEKK